MISLTLKNELKARYNPDGSDLRKAQIRMKEMLIFLDRICTEYNLNYWIDSGTLLGAKRHKGFIPWDDDVDVCMMKKDAEKLKLIMKDRIWDNHIILQTHETDQNYYNVSWMTLRDTKSEYIINEYSHNCLMFRGLQIDIFIIEENIPPLILKICRLMYMGLIYFPLWNWFGLKILRPLIPLNYKILTKHIFPFLNRINTKSTLVSSGLGCQYLNIHEKGSIFPLKRIEFEGIKLLSPANTEEYLQSLYGEWQKIPSQENIITHNALFKFYD